MIKMVLLFIIAVTICYSLFAIISKSSAEQLKVVAYTTLKLLGCVGLVALFGLVIVVLF